MAGGPRHDGDAAEAAQSQRHGVRRDRLLTLREEKRKRMQAEAVEKGGEEAPKDGEAGAEASTSTASTSHDPSVPTRGLRSTTSRMNPVSPYTPSNYPEEFEIFQSLDTDGDSLISGMELRCGLRRVDMEETAVRLLAAMYSVDTTGIYSVSLNFAQFVEALQCAMAYAGNQSEVTKIKAALSSKPPLRPGYWNDNEKYVEVTGRKGSRVPSEMDLWRRAKEATKGDRRRNEILTELRSAIAGKDKRRRGGADAGDGNASVEAEKPSTAVKKTREEKNNEKKDGAGAPKNAAFRRAANLIRVLSRWFENSHQPPVFSVYLSCGVRDTVQEREYLMRWVYPELRAIAARHGLHFNLVDNRASLLSEIAAYDPHTAGVCTNEVKLCGETGLSVSFLHLGTDKYGWKPLPPSMRENDFQELLGALADRKKALDSEDEDEEDEGDNGSDSEDANDATGEANFNGNEDKCAHCDFQTALEKWYRLDVNAKPPEYCLLPPRTLIPELDSESRNDIDGGLRQWRKERKRLTAEIEAALRYLTALEHEAAGGSDSDDEEEEAAKKYQAASEAATGHLRQQGIGVSVVDAELSAGMLNLPPDVDVSEKALCFERKMKEFNHRHQSAPLFVDLNQDMSVDKDAKQALAKQRFIISKALPTRNLYRYECKWNNPDILKDSQLTPDMTRDDGDEAAVNLNIVAAEDVRRMCADIRQALVDRLETAMELKPPAVDALGQELMAQSTFFDRVGKECYCRDATVERVHFYLEGDCGVSSPLILFGKPGVGKTAVMANLAAEAMAWGAAGVDAHGNTPPLVIGRFCGVTEASSHSKSLVRGLCMQLAAYCSTHQARGVFGQSGRNPRRSSHGQSDNNGTVAGRLSTSSQGKDFHSVRERRKHSVRPAKQKSSRSVPVAKAEETDANSANAKVATAGAMGLSLDVDDTEHDFDFDFWLRRCASSTGRDIVVFIDNLEVLCATEDGKDPFKWLPLVLPPKVRIVISVTASYGMKNSSAPATSGAKSMQIVVDAAAAGGGGSGGSGWGGGGDIATGDAIVRLLSNRGTPKSAFVQVDAFSMQTSEMVLQEMLRRSGRVLTLGQFKVVKNMLRTSPEAGSGLYLKMLHRHVSKWTSLEDPEFNKPEKENDSDDEPSFRRKPSKDLGKGAGNGTGKDEKGGRTLDKYGSSKDRFRAAMEAAAGTKDKNAEDLGIRPIPFLPGDIPSMLMTLFDSLERDHGALLVSRAFAYVSLSLTGLTRRELGDVLSCDAEVLEEVNKHMDDAFSAASAEDSRARAVAHAQALASTSTSPSSQGSRRVPPLIISRLLADVGDLMMEIYSGCGLVLRWQHRDLWTYVGARYIPDAATKRRLSKALVDYFDGTSHHRHPDRGVQSQPMWLVHPVLGAEGTAAAGVPNMRRVIELPNALILSEDFARLGYLLSDLDLFEIMDSSGESGSMRSGGNRELGHSHGREALHALWMKAEVRAKACKAEAIAVLESAVEESKKPPLPPEPRNPGAPKVSKKTSTNPVADAEARVAAVVVPEMGECYLYAIRRLQARLAANVAAVKSKPGRTSVPTLLSSASFIGSSSSCAKENGFDGSLADANVAEVAEDVAKFVAEAGKLNAAISISEIAVELREKVAEQGDVVEMLRDDDKESSFFLANKIDLSEALFNHSELFKRMGMAKKALDFMKRAHSILRNALGQHAPETVSMMHKIATSCSTFGLYEDALAMYKEIESQLTAHADDLDAACSAETGDQIKTSSSKLVSVVNKKFTMKLSGSDKGLAAVARQVTAKRLSDHVRANLGVVLSNQGAMLVSIGRAKEALEVLDRASENMRKYADIRASSQRGLGATLDARLSVDSLGSTKHSRALNGKVVAESLRHNTAAARLMLGDVTDIFASGVTTLHEELLSQENNGTSSDAGSRVARVNFKDMDEDKQQQRTHHASKTSLSGGLVAADLATADPAIVQLLASSIINLALAQSRTGQHRLALVSSRRAVNLLENLSHEPNFSLAVALNATASVLAAAQRPGHAISFYDRCLDILEFVLEDTNPHLQSCVASRAACLIAMGRGAEAADGLTRALFLAHKQWERARETRKDPAGAAPAHADRRTSFDSVPESHPPPENHEVTATAEVALLDGLELTGRSDADMRAQSSGDSEKRADEATATLLRAQVNLARFLYNQGHHDKALALQLSTLHLMAKVHGVSDEVIAAYNSLAVMYQRRGMRKEALDVVRKRMELIGHANDERLPASEPPLGSLSPWYNVTSSAEGRQRKT